MERNQFIDMIDCHREQKEMAMTWDFATGQEVVRIETVRGDEVTGLIAELPLSCEGVAETMCDTHNHSTDLMVQLLKVAVQLLSEARDRGYFDPHADDSEEEANLKEDATAWPTEAGMVLAAL